MTKHDRLLRLLVPCLAVVFVTITACSDSDLFPSSSLTLPPDAIDDAMLAYDPASGAAFLSWTAPRTNGGTTQLRRYDIRYVYDDTFDWGRAEEVLDPPPPSDSGRRQSYRFDRAQRGRMLRAAVRTIDASGNTSEPGNVATLALPGFSVGGVARDVLSGEGVAGLAVVYDTGATRREAMTGPDGRFVIDDLHEADGVLSVRSLQSPSTYFPLAVDFLVSRDSATAFDMIPFAQSAVAPDMSLLTLLKAAVGVRSGSQILRKWPSRPVDLYVPAFVNAYGMDYRAAAFAAAERWMELTTVPLFRLVDAPPASGVEMVFRTPAEMGIQVGYAVHTNTADGTPLRSVINIVNTFTNPIALRRTMLHELGHTIRLEHLPAGFLMFGGQPLPDDPTEDEVWVVRLQHAIPDRTDLSIYHEVDE